MLIARSVGRRNQLIRESRRDCALVPGILVFSSRPRSWIIEFSLNKCESQTHSLLRLESSTRLISEWKNNTMLFLWIRKLLENHGNMINYFYLMLRWRYIKWKRFFSSFYLGENRIWKLIECTCTRLPRDRHILCRKLSAKRVDDFCIFQTRFSRKRDRSRILFHIFGLFLLVEQLSTRF